MEIPETITIMFDRETGVWNAASIDVDEEFWNEVLGPLVVQLCENLDAATGLPKEEKS